MSFTGTVRSGSGGVSRYLNANPDALKARSRAAGVDLYPGTLNLDVDDVGEAIRSLGEPDFRTDTDNERLGPLRWWKVALRYGGRSPVAFVVRHERTATDFIEIMAGERLRVPGVVDGTKVDVYS